MSDEYRAFIERKQQSGKADGFAPVFEPDFPFDFQKYLNDWAIRRGRALISADTGLGKTICELVFAENVVRKTNKPVLLLTMLGVTHQIQAEAERFGIDAERSRDGTHSGKRIVIANYESLHKFDEADFAGVVMDEASAIKAWGGVRRKQVTRFMSKMRYRLGATATAAPNDFIELGTLSEAIGEMTQSDMLSTFFVSSDKKRDSLFKEGDFWNRAKYFFKPYGESAFWRWVCTWARTCRKPSDLGDFDDTRFKLPPLEQEQHVVGTEFIFPCELFPRIAATLAEQRVERRRTIRERCEKVVELCSQHDEPSVIWCQYNQEGELLAKMIPGAAEVAGRHSDDEKEERLIAFAQGQIQKLVTKGKIAGWGSNWQHCGHQVMFPSHSFELAYQCIRRSWRFGRVGRVKIDVVSTEGECGVMDNLLKKQAKANVMFDNLVRYMRDSLGVKMPEKHVNELVLPSWI